MPAEIEMGSGTGTLLLSERAVLEAQLLKIWREMLGASSASAEDNFFEAGGTSLLAARLASRLTRDLGRSIAATDILAHPSVRRLAQKLSGNGGKLDREAADARAERQRSAFGFRQPPRSAR